MRLERADLALAWLHLVARNWRLPEDTYRLLVSEAMAGHVWAGMVDELPVALGGVLVPRADLPGTAWLSILPGLEPATVLRAALLMRRVVDAAASAHEPGVVCCVEIENARGHRLAQALGFRCRGADDGRLIEWRREWPASAR